MVEKTFSLKNYLEPVDLEYQELEKILEEDQKIDELESYPFTKQELFSYLVTPEFLSSINYQLEKEEKSIDIVDIKNIFESIPLEKKLEQIEFEKRRRYQAYKLLEYNLSTFTYFDFFSFDAFQLAKNAKFFAQLYKKAEVNLELLFLPFFDSTLEIGKLLKEFGFDENFIQTFSLNLKDAEELKAGKIQEKSRPNFLQNIKENIETMLSKYFDIDSFSEIEFDQEIKYSYDVHQLFEKSSENALNRFKSPIITPEILFVTLMEDKTSKVGKKIKKLLGDETRWYLLRYKLLKRLYSQEISVRSQVVRNQQFFGYLLKTKISEVNFEKLSKRKLLGKATALFRDLIIIDLMKNDLFEKFDQETQASILISPKRCYST